MSEKGLSHEIQQNLESMSPQDIANNLWTFKTGAGPILEELMSKNPRKGALFARELVHKKPAYRGFFEEAMGRKEANDLLTGDINNFFDPSSDR